MAEDLKVSAGAPRGAGERRNWLIAGAGALLAAILVLGLFSRSPAPPPAAAPPRPVPAVVFGSGAADETELFSPTPLFLPTRWNVQPQHLPAGVARGPDAGFAAF